MTLLEEAIAAAKPYTRIKDFRADYPAFYSRIAKHKAYDVAFGHIKKMRTYQADYDNGRTCTKCGVHKDIQQFYKTSSKSKRRCAICKKCSNEQRRAWRIANRERSREIVRRCAAKAGKEAERARAKIKRRKNPSAAAARDMLKRCLALTGQRKSRTTEQILGYSSVQLRGHIASQFAEGMTWDNWGKWHIDHITPVAVMVRNGITDPAVINSLENLRPLWAKDNLSKIWEARGDSSN